MAKRVNTRFLIILSIIVCVMAVAAVALTVVLRKSAAGYVRDGDAKMARGDFKGARDAYGRARGREPSNVEALTKLGDACDALASTDPEHLMAARAVWNEAVTVNPRYVPALRRLADSYWDHVQVAPTSNDVYRMVRESHARLLDALPADAPEAERAAVEARLHLGTIAPWLRMNAPVNRKEVADSVGELEKLAPKDPANAEIPTAVALAYVKWSTEANAAGKEEDKQKLLLKAIGQIKTSLKGQEKNAAMQLAAYQLYNATLPLQWDDAAKKAAQSAAADALAAAVVAAKPDDVVYIDVIVQAAVKAAQDGQPKEAEKLYQELLAKRPEDPRARLIAAKAMAADKKKRDQAIELFAKPVVAQSNERGAKSLRNREWEIRMLLELVGLRMEKYQESTDEAARAAISKTIDQDFQRLQTLLPADAVPFLRLKARHQQLLGDNVAAIQSYAKAVELTGTPNTPDEYDLMSELAQAYLRARPPQVGAAQRLLDPVARKYPAHVPTRLLLANISLDDNDLETAAAHADDLQKYAPNSPQVMNLRATILARSKADAATVDAFLKSLPEADREQRLVKAQIAGSTLNRVPEASRLLRANVAADPKDLASLEGLIRSLLVEKKNDEARQLVADAAKADPGNESLKKAVEDLDALLKQQNLTPTEQYDAAVARVTKELKDKPLAMAVSLGDLARRYNKPDEAEKQYHAAEQKDPNDLGVIAKLYELLMERKKADQAKPYLEKLVKANADGRDGLALETRYALATNDFEGAARRAQALTTRWPEFGESWLLSGQALQGAGKHSEAVNQYAAARQRQGKNAEAIKGMIECYYATGHPVEARAEILEGRKLFPNEQLFRELELGHEVTYGDPEKAIPYREQAYKEAPDDKPRLLVLVEAYGRAGLIKYANDPDKRKLYLDKARGLMAEAARRWPDDPRMVGGLADVMMATGEVEQGEKTLIAFGASPTGKDGHQAQVMLANYYMRSGKPDEAVLAMRSALSKSKGDKEVRRLLIAMLAQQRKYDEALTALDDAPKDETLFVRQRIEVLLAAGRRPEAEQAIRDAMGATPQIASELRILLTTLFIDSNKLDDAAAEIEKELAVNPKNAAAFYYRAMVKLRRPQRDVGGAMTDLQKVRQIDPNNVPSRLLMADAHNASGSRQQAVTELEDALRLAPLNTDVRKRLIDTYALRGEWAEVMRLTTEGEATPGIDNDPVWPMAASRALSQQNPPDYKAALAAMGRAVKRAPQNNAELVRELLALLHKAGEDKELLRLSDEFITAGRKDWWIYQHRGMAKAAAKDVSGALAEFDKALADADRIQNDKAAEAIVQSMADELGADKALERAVSRGSTELRWKAVTASLYQLKNDWPNAVKEADQLLLALAAPQAAGATAPDAKLKLSSLRTAATIYHFAKPTPLIEKAQAAYLKVLELQPGDYFALNNLAVLLAEDATPPNPQEARKYSEEAYNLVRRVQPMVSRVVDTHAWVLILNGEVDEAMPLLRSVVDNDPFAEARYHLAEGYLRKNRGEEALQQLTAAKEELLLVKSLNKEVDTKLLRKVEDALARARATQNEAKAQ